ncbi:MULTISPECIES: cob(I)yrinic acid a,c-diamide adenosyltransferase [Thermus]|uniref:Cob(I)yrinic acid a,c-diamide adenosyltransferase n=1 Tax=Thermus tengchongensis TaxID=1214928 RepID=A0ABY2K2X3_9DEIN|nr:MULTISPECIES: cob(I)yrinic acid a,c-diamide adenosyltransferase [Thermus]TFU13948.1 cob(I)yrinic acid a,c-diamide adenosyltransferase [Thermus tengchongensis]
MEEPKRVKPYAKPQGERRGLLLVYTGDGKGKSTAAFGLALRAHGRGLRVRIFQFLKHQGARFGEHRALEALGIPIEGLGDGFTWKSRDLEASKALALEGWKRAKEALLSGAWDLVVLDEATYPLRYGWISLEEFLDTLRSRPRHVHVVVTGRGAPEPLLALADTVTEMRKVKHAFDLGVPAQVGVEH